MTPEKILEIAGTIVGLVYIWLEYRASVWLWLAGIIMPAIYIYVYYSSGFYADMGINIYYLIAGLWGWAVWLGKSLPKSMKQVGAVGKEPVSGVGKAGEKTPVNTGQQHETYDNKSQVAGKVSHETNPDEASDGKQTAGKQKSANQTTGALPISRTPKKLFLPLFVISMAFFVLIAWILINFTDSTVPYGDSLTTALSIVALWMLARKYAEQWLVWIVVDVICCGLYVYKGLDFTAALYGLYAVIAVFGYRKWLRMMKEQE